MPETNDPIRLLESFGTGGVDVHPLDPSQVRRLGDRRRSRRRAAYTVAAAAAVVAAVVPIAALTGGEDAAPLPPAHSGPPAPAPTESPTASTATDTSRVISYPGIGVEVTTASETGKLTGTTVAFQQFIGDVWRRDKDAGCPTPDVTVKKYSDAGYALGAVGGCGGYQALWVMQPDSGIWLEGLSTQDAWDCDGLHYLGVPTSFAGDCFNYSGGFGPKEVDGLRLGMTKPQIEAAGGTVFGDPSVDCNGVRLPHSTQPEGQSDGFYSSRYGLVALTARPGDKTDENVGLGSTEAKVTSAYPNGTPTGDGHRLVPLTNGNAYFIGIGDGTVNQMILVGPHRNSENSLPLCLG